MAKRTDSNHAVIRQAFRDRGFSWMDTYMVGKGFPDGVVGRYGINVLIEIKDGEKPPSKRKLTPDEQEFHGTWLGWVEVVKDEVDVGRICADLLLSRFIMDLKKK